MDKVSDALSAPLLTPLKQIFHPKGDVYHALKATDAGYAGFGEAYFTTVIEGETKGWKKHLRMQMNLVVPVGQVCFYVHDENSGVTTSYLLGAGHYARLTVPPGYWMAFRGMLEGTNLVCNLASIAHDPLEAMNVALETYPLEMPA
jgi:dTDP-4-dehydrorhamnose 3,5-epimerase